jgi:hypothetical protein
MTETHILQWAGVVLPALCSIACLWLGKNLAEFRLQINEQFVTKQQCCEHRTICKEFRELAKEGQHAD